MAARAAGSEFLAWLHAASLLWFGNHLHDVKAATTVMIAGIGTGDEEGDGMQFRLVEVQRGHHT